LEGPAAFVTGDLRCWREARAGGTRGKACGTDCGELASAVLGWAFRTTTRMFLLLPTMSCPGFWLPSACRCCALVLLIQT